jgi:hypothetical protein
MPAAITLRMILAWFVSMTFEHGESLNFCQQHGKFMLGVGVLGSYLLLALERRCWSALCSSIHEPLHAAVTPEIEVQLCYAAGDCWVAMRWVEVNHHRAAASLFNGLKSMRRHKSAPYTV